MGSVDAAMMARAIELAGQGDGRVHPNPRVGAVVVRDERVIGEGFHAVCGEAHAEVHALNAAGGAAKGATIYISLEPCCHSGKTPQCTQAIINAGIKRVVYACDDADPRVAGNGAQRLRDAGIEVIGGVMEDEARALNEHFFHRIENRRPWLTLKMAMSIDGRTALKNRQSQWITGQSARADVHVHRQQFHAILTGIGTVRTDNPRLSARGEHVVRQPERIIIDALAETPLDAAVFDGEGRTIVICGERAEPTRVAAMRSMGVHVLDGFAVNERGRMHLAPVFSALGELPINSIWLECGSALAAALFRESLIDEYVMYTGNCIIGEDGYPLMRTASPQTMDALSRYALKDCKVFENDVRLTYRPKRH